MNAKLVNENLNEIYSEKDLKLSDELKDISLGINFKQDYRKLTLAIKKLVRLKYQIKDIHIQNKIDDILNLLY